MHREYTRIVAHSDKAILFIHGIVGTPNHFHIFMPLVPEGISVYNVLLDGHGKSVKDFSQTSMKKWEAQITCIVDELARTHDKIYVVGHSLGCLLAIEQAVRNPKISKLFLLAVPLRLSLKPKMLVNSFHVYTNKIDPQNPELMAAKQCCGVTPEKNPLQYLGWVPRFLELFSKIGKTRKIIQDLNIPCFAYQSSKDEMVSAKSKSILEQNPMICVTQLQNSGHYYYAPKDLTLLKQAFTDFIL